MSMTQAQLLAALTDEMNATGSSQWSPATLLSWLDLAFWQEWANILNANNVYYSQSVTVTLDSNGQFAISALTNGSADAVKNFYRVLSLAQPQGGNQPCLFYRQTRYQDYPNPQPNQGTYLSGLWYRLGQQIQVMPVQSGLQLSVQVNYRPPRPSQLSGSSVVVDFPDGYEMLLVFVAAMYALNKGGSETEAAGTMSVMATNIRAMMLMDLARQGTWPIVATAFDSPQDWGGVFLFALGLGAAVLHHLPQLMG